MIANADNLIPCTARLEDINEGLVGGKAWNLFRLHRLGLPVPRWWVVPCPVFDAVLSSLREEIESILAVVDFMDQSALNRASDWIRALILEAKGPGETGRSPRPFPAYRVI